MRTPLPSVVKTSVFVLIFATSPLAFAQTWDPATGLLSERRISISDIGTTHEVFYSNASILGGERDLSLTLTGEDGMPASSLLTTGTVTDTMSLSVSMGDGQQGLAEFVWDGVDSSSTLDYTGLGGVDLTASYDGLDFLFTSDVNAVTWTFYFYTDEFNYSTYTLAKPAGTSPTNVPYSPDFSSFVAAGGTGADFSNIGAIRITTDASLALDSRLNNLQFSAVPEPSTSVTLALGAASLLFNRRRRRA